ncbi:MAG TPA: hypothetical protein VLC48_07915 [Gemmatimonadota bacterium]|nr:hypothetical protein [Gemmatimonadota bacterium]
MDWETKVLKRVERHVESVARQSACGVAPVQKLGWEEASLLALRRRLGSLESE